MGEGHGLFLWEDVGFQRDLRKQEMLDSNSHCEAAVERRAQAHRGDTGGGHPVSSGNVPRQHGTLVQKDRAAGRHSSQPAFCLRT